MGFFKKRLTDEEFITKFISEMEYQMAHYERDARKVNMHGLFYPIKKKRVERISNLLDQINQQSETFHFEIEYDERTDMDFIHIIRK